MYLNHLSDKEGKTCCESFFTSLYTVPVYTRWCHITTGPDLLAWDTPYSTTGVKWLLDYFIAIYPQLKPPHNEEDIKGNANDECYSIGACCDAFLQALYGTKTFYMWSYIKKQLGYDTEAAYITWMINAITEKNNENSKEPERQKHYLESLIHEYGINDQTNSDDTAVVRYKCRVCGLDSPYHVVTVQHIEHDHISDISADMDDMPRYKCNICNYTTVDQIGILRHFKCHIQKRIHQCLLCRRAFKRPSHLTEHVWCVHLKVSREESIRREQMAKMVIQQNRGANNKRSLVCEICHAENETKGDLHHHWKMCHPDFMPYECKICNMKFKIYNHLYEHLTLEHHAVKHQRSLYECTKCDFTCRKESTLQRHQVMHSDARPFKCEDCEKVFKRPNSLNKHMRNVHGKRRSVSAYTCSECDNMTFSTKGQYKEHVDVIHGGIVQRNVTLIQSDPVNIANGTPNSAAVKPNVCPICVKIFSRHSDMVEHLRCVHRNDREALTTLGLTPYDVQACQHCGFNAMSARQLRAHVRKKHDLAATVAKTCYICGACGKMYKYGKSLQHHMFTAHNPDAAAVTGHRYVCEHCGLSYKQSGRYNEHVMTKHPDDGVQRKPYSCHICGKLYALQRYVTDHIKHVHLEMRSEQARDFVCDICGKKFANQSKLDMHVLTHSKKKQHFCHTCNKGFKYRHNIMRHVRVFHGQQMGRITSDAARNLHFPRIIYKYTEL